MGLSGVGGPGYQDLTVLYQNGIYQVNGKPVSEQEANKALAGNHITAKDGLFRTSDGFEIGDDNNGAATEFGGRTPLPSVAGPFAPVSAVQNKSMWSGNMSDGALMWQAMSEMAKVSMREMKDAKDIKRAMNQGKIEAKQAQINATEQQIAAEREAAKEAFITSCIAAAVTIVVACIGAGVSSSSSGWGQAIGSMATPLGSVAQKAGDWYSKSEGAQREADEQKLVAKRYERQEAIMDDAIDEAKGQYEEAKEQFKLAVRILQEHMERQTQVVQKITS